MDYRGITVIIIVTSLGASLVMIIASMCWRDRPLTDKGGEVVIATISGFLMALGYYIGSKK